MARTTLFQECAGCLAPLPPLQTYYQIDADEVFCSKCFWEMDDEELGL